MGVYLLVLYASHHVVLYLFYTLINHFYRYLLLQLDSYKMIPPLLREALA